MPEVEPPRTAAQLLKVSNAMVALHKEQFGRGPTKARSHFAGDDVLICVLEDVLLPAERKLVDMGNQDRVRDSRHSFQVATQPEFVTAVEQIVGRKVHSPVPSTRTATSCSRTSTSSGATTAMALRRRNRDTLTVLGHGRRALLAGGLSIRARGVRSLHRERSVFA